MLMNGKLCWLWKIDIFIALHYIMATVEYLNIYCNIFFSIFYFFLDVISKQFYFSQISHAIKYCFYLFVFFSVSDRYNKM